MLTQVRVRLPYRAAKRQLPTAIRRLTLKVDRRRRMLELRRETASRRTSGCSAAGDRSSSSGRGTFLRSRGKRLAKKSGLAESLAVGCCCWSLTAGERHSSKWQTRAANRLRVDSQQLVASGYYTSYIQLCTPAASTREAKASAQSSTLAILVPGRASVLTRPFLPSLPLTFSSAFSTSCESAP